MRLRIGAAGLFVLSLGAIATAAPCQTTPTVQPYRYLSLPVALDVPVPPTPARAIDGKTYLSYLIVITNWGAAELRLAAVEALESRTGGVVLRWSGDTLADARRLRSLWPSRASEQRQDFRVLAPSSAVVVFAWAELGGSIAVPRELLHRVTFEPTAAFSIPGGDSTSRFRVIGARVALDTMGPPVIGPPLRGGPWRCGNGLGQYNTHFQAVSFILARPDVSQRFACDFRKLDSAGEVLTQNQHFQDSIPNQAFYAYGDDVLAVADGEIAAIRDGIPENVPYVDGRVIMAVPWSRETSAGNWIALKIGTAQYALYAHLQPGSIRFRVGQHVKRGQVLGLLGNSGNSVGPHIHFQLADQPEFNAGSGLPYRLDQAAVLVGQKISSGSPVAIRPLDVLLDGTRVFFTAR